MAAAALATASLSSCIYDDQSECPSVKISYTYNMKYADAAPHEVDNVKLYAYDSDHNLVYTKEVGSEELKNREYTLNMAGFPESAAEIITWGFGTERNADSYTFGDSQKETNLTCLINSNSGAVTSDLTPLFYAKNPASVVREHGVIDLMKDTNVVRIILQNQTGEPLSPDDFVFEITAANCSMNYDNSLADSQTLTYSPWNVYTGSAGMNSNDASDATISVVAAEFTVGRLVDGQRNVVTVYRKSTGDKVFSIPLNDFALLVKGSYNSSMSNQEYLDRQDEWNMTFFLTSGGKWIASSIIINSWRVVLSNVDL